MSSGSRCPAWYNTTAFKLFHKERRMKKRLFTPGPISVPEEVLLEMAKPVIHHRTKEFLKIAEEVFGNLNYFFQTEGDVFILASSGTGAMETALVNTLSPGDGVLVLSAGKFGERFAEIGNAYGCRVVSVEPGWGNPFDLAEIEKILAADPGIRAVCATLCETSTASSCDIEGIGKIVKKFPETLLVVDGISGLGAVPCMTDAWGLDVVVSGSQKALMLPPGLAFISVSGKAWKAVEKSTLPKFYFDLKKYRKTLAKFDFPWTMAVSLVAGLKKSLDLIKAETLEAMWARHRVRAEATRSAATALGLKVFSKTPSDAVTAIVLPGNVDGEKFVSQLRDTFGITFAGGQDALKGKIVRISHFGWQDEFDTLTAVSALEVMLAKHGYSFTPGSGVRAATAILFP